MMEKNLIRQQMLAKRAQLSSENVVQLSEIMINKIQKDPDFITAKVVAIYHPIQNEIDLRTLYQKNKVFLLPKIEENELSFYKWSPSDQLQKSTFGILEPTTKHKFNQRIDLILVPALAIDRHNNRIGYGKGYYDRFLKTHPYGKTIGVIYDFQEVDSIDREEHDQILDRYYKV